MITNQYYSNEIVLSVVLKKQPILTLLLGILFQLIVFILVFGMGVSCCGSLMSRAGAGVTAGTQMEAGGLAGEGDRMVAAGAALVLGVVV